MIFTRLLLFGISLSVKNLVPDFLIMFEEGYTNYCFTYYLRISEYSTYLLYIPLAVKRGCVTKTETGSAGLVTYLWPHNVALINMFSSKMERVIFASLCIYVFKNFDIEYVSFFF